MVTHGQTPHPHLKFRPDIEGLRGLAVFLVIFFHAFPLRLSGGYVGVDIFFVISGYLIFGIIHGQLTNNTFTFSSFYENRIRRIFPPLIFVLFITLGFGWAILFPSDYAKLGLDTLASTVFISNYVYLHNSGYFEQSSTNNPLLHLWSLSVEEQFYFIFPGLLVLYSKLKKKMLWLIVPIILISFMYNIYASKTNISLDFYSFTTRAWEFTIGSVGYLFNISKFQQQSKKLLLDIFSVIGISLVLYSSFYFSDKTNFPGIYATIPVIGTLLLLASNEKSFANRYLLTLFPLRFLGRISYSLYLWHWPILAFSSIIFLNQTPSFVKGIALLAACLLGFTSYKLIEVPAKNPRSSAKFYAFLLGMLGLFGYFIGINDGLRNRLTAQNIYLDYFENSRPDQKYFKKINILENWNDKCSFFDGDKYRENNSTEVPRVAISSDCYIKKYGVSNTVFIWGDSHAQHLYSGLRDSLPKNWQILQVATSGCMPSLGNANRQSMTNHCDQSNWFAKNTIIKVNPTVVIIATKLWPNYESINELTSFLSIHTNSKIIVVGPTPQWTTPLPNIIQRSLWYSNINRTNIGIDRAVALANNEYKIKMQSNNAKYADLINTLCDKTGCLMYFNGDRQSGITTWDYGHLTPISSKYIADNTLLKLILEK